MRETKRLVLTSETALFVVLTALLTACGCAVEERTGRTSESQAGFVPIFDGESFEGWEGNLDMFRIEDKAIVGGTLQGRIERNEFLSTVKEYRDFELRLQFKLLGDDANAGVQFRSRRSPNHHEMIGYQADLGQQYWGCLYDESRRHRTLAGADQKKVSEILNRDCWNDYFIRCADRRIELWVNGYKTVDYTEADDSIERQGVIGLQIHGGPPSEAWYKNIRIKELGDALVGEH